MLLTSRVIFIFFLFFFSDFIIAQSGTKIIGHIKDQESGKPVDLATVFVRNLNISTETNEDGNYELNIPGNPAELVLEVSRISYKSAAFKLNQLTSGATVTIDFELTLENSTLEVIVRESAVRTGGMIKENI